MRSVTLHDRARLIQFLQDRSGVPRRVSVPEVTAALLRHGGIADALQILRPAQGTLDLDEESPGISSVERQIESWESDGVRVETILDDGYPAQLRDIHEAPPIVFMRGPLSGQERGVSVVGSRKASPRGIQIATSVAAALATEGLTVIAGLAAGIDSAAHRTALEAGGQTLAVIGTGIDISYPAANRDLQAVIGDRGLLLSQFWPGSPPRREHFPIRNATMSGMGIATFVAEAGEQSGARIQARKAVEHGRPVILSDLVVERNEWAKLLLGRPNVWEAGTVDAVLSIVRHLDGSPTAIDELLMHAADSVARGA